MGKALLVPLNTNHVAIFEGIVKLLNCEYEVLCHDKISEAQQYHTENILKKKKIPYRNFSKRIDRSPENNLVLKIINFFKMKKEIRNALKKTSPKLIVLAIDNDPISQIFLKESRMRGIQTLLIQEALIRPNEYSMREKYLSDYLYSILRLFGIYLTYTKYGDGKCDKILLGGKIAAEIMKIRGVPENRIRIVGLPKYDTFLEKTKSIPPVNNKRTVYLFAPSTKIVHDDRNIRFLKRLVATTHKLGLHLIIKLHPRTSHAPSDIYKVVNVNDKSLLEIVKEGDETFEILKRSDGFITVSSTMILDALMMGKECIAASYLAGESRLDYDQYDAIHTFESEDDIYDVIKNSMLSKKSFQNKKRLLEDELYRLDSQASLRAARVIENMIL